jgi:hypothetical protein
LKNQAVNIIDSYRFGRIVVDGREYSSDVIILPHGVSREWWRKKSHELCLEDISEVMAANPELLVVGIGASGLVEVLPEVEQAAQSQGVKLIKETTDKACQIYNQLCRSQRVAAALHLTC